MAITSESTTVWTGTLFEGSGRVSLDSSQAADLKVDWKTRSEGGVGTSTPEELIAAAHSSCFSMALSNVLTEAGFPPNAIQTTAAVTFQPGVGILGSHLLVNATVPGIPEERFAELAEDAKENCPVSKALAGLTITLEATLA